MGEFITRSLEDVKQNLNIAELDDEYNWNTSNTTLTPV